jgi:hypothetical protein
VLSHMGERARVLVDPSAPLGCAVHFCGRPLLIGGDRAPTRARMPPQIPQTRQATTLPWSTPTSCAWGYPATCVLRWSTPGSLTRLTRQLTSPLTTQHTGGDLGGCEGYNCFASLHQHAAAAHVARGASKRRATRACH